MGKHRRLHAEVDVWLCGGWLGLLLAAGCGGESVRREPAGSLGGAGTAASGGTGGRSGSGGSSAACCLEDADCSFSRICSSGQCVGGLLTDGACWRDSDCRDGQLCSTAYVPACGEEASGVSEAGWCVAPDASCCFGHEDCGSDALCLRGNCKTRPESGCFDRRHCEDESELCYGEALCTCGTSCLAPDSPGACAIPR